MGITPVHQNGGIADVAKAAPTPAKVPVQPQVAQKKDTASISEAAKDMAAQLTGKTIAEEAKESPVVEAREEQGKLHH